MAKASKKLVALILSLIMIFGCTTMATATASEPIDSEFIDSGLIFEDEPPETVVANVFQTLQDAFHKVIDVICSILGVKCPLCDEFKEGDEQNPVAAYNAAVNALKNSTSGIKIAKVTTVMGKVSTAVESVTEALQKELDEYTGTVAETVVFNGGVAIDGTARTITGFVSPVNAVAAVTQTALKNSSITKKKGITNIALIFKEDEATITGEKYVGPSFHQGLIKSVNPLELDLGTTKILGGTIKYDGSMALSKLASDGRVQTIEISTPMDVVLNLKLATTGIMASVDVTYKETYQISYATNG